MRFSPLAFALCIASVSAFAQTDFSGSWRLNAALSQMRGLPTAPATFLKVEQNADSLTLTMSEAEGGPFQVAVFSLAYGKSERSNVGEFTWNSATKWEGRALLVNTIVSGPQDYAQDERWSRDAHRLTIERTIRRPAGEVESMLLYEDGMAPAMMPEPPPMVTRSRAPARAPQADSREFVVPTGTRILLKLSSSINTKRTQVGDKIYLQTAAPVFIDRQLVIPVGSYVAGVVTESQEAGRVKGKSSVNLRFESLTLPNGVTRDFRSRAGSVDTKGNLDRSEGRITGDGNKAGDAASVGKTTGAATGVGAVAGAAAGHLGMGAGIGAAAGAIGGLVGVLSSRGPEVVLPPGTTMEMVLDRDVSYASGELTR